MIKCEILTKKGLPCKKLARHYPQWGKGLCALHFKEYAKRYIAPPMKVAGIITDGTPPK